MYAGEVGVPRLLKLFKKYNITTTWFIPGMMRCNILHTDDLQIVFVPIITQVTASRHFQIRWLPYVMQDMKCSSNFSTFCLRSTANNTSTTYCNIADFTDTLTKWALLFPCLTCFQNITNILESTPTANSRYYRLWTHIKKRCDTCFTFFLLLPVFFALFIIGTKFHASTHRSLMIIDYRSMTKESKINEFRTTTRHSRLHSQTAYRLLWREATTG